MGTVTNSSAPVRSATYGHNYFKLLELGLRYDAMNSVALGGWIRFGGLSQYR